MVFHNKVASGYSDSLPQRGAPPNIRQRYPFCCRTLQVTSSALCNLLRHKEKTGALQQDRSVKIKFSEEVCAEKYCGHAWKIQIAMLFYTLLLKEEKIEEKKDIKNDGMIL